MSFVTNSIVARFITDTVNLSSDRERKYRKQVSYLRDRFASYAADHPGLTLVKLLNSGSLKKRTQTSKLNDIDVAAYVDLGEVTGETVDRVDRLSVLQDVCETLRLVYGNTKSASDFEVRSTAVAIHFHGSGLDVDVVPVIVDRKSHHNEGWVLRNGAPALRTSISRHAEFIKNVHDAHPGYRELVRLTKWWRTTHEISARSFLIELILAHLCRMKLLDPSKPLDAFETFVDWLADERLDMKIWFDDWFPEDGSFRDLPFVMDPVNPLNNAADKMQGLWGPTQRLHDLVEAADRASALLSEARAARTKGQAQSSMARLFGSAFKGVMK